MQLWKMTSPDDPYFLGYLQCPAIKGRSLHDDASHFYQHEMGFATPFRKFFVLDDEVKAINLINHHVASDLDSVCMMRDFRFIEASVL